MIEYNGKEYDRVTEVLWPFTGLEFIDKEILKAANLRGKIVHQHCDNLIDNLGAFGLLPEHQGYIDSFMQWYEGMKDIKFLDEPGRLYCEDHMITGEVDEIYKSNDGNRIIDFKTSAKESPTWCLQGSAYYYLCKKNGIEVCDHVTFLKLDKKGKSPCEYHYKADVEGYLECLRIYRKFFKNKPKPDYLDFL